MRHTVAMSKPYSYSYSYLIGLGLLAFSASSTASAKPPSCDTPATAATLDSSAETAPPEKDTTTVPPSTKKDGEKRKLHSVALTFGPFQAIFGVAQVSVEGRLARKLGLAGIVGGGSLGKPFTGDARVPVLAAGVSPRYYLVGDFDHGMQLGAQLMTAIVLTSWDTAVGVAAGPYIGYKYTAPIGFTLEVQGGAQYAFASTSRSPVVGSGALPMANINLGWAF